MFYNTFKGSHNTVVTSNDEQITVKTQDRSDVSVDEIAAIILSNYGMKVKDLKVLGGEVDHNLRVTDAHGVKFLAKLSPMPYSQDAFTWQEAVLEHLAKHPISVEFPRLLRNSHERTHSVVVVGDEKYYLRLFKWIDGELMATTSYHPPRLLHDLGHVAGEITTALDGLVQPSNVDDHHWLVTRSLEAIHDSFDAITDSYSRARVEKILDWYKEASKVFSYLPIGTVHQDLNDFNVLIRTSDDGEPHLTGVLDFNDAVTTIRVSEVAVAAAYAMLRKSDPISAFLEVVAGYRCVIEMTDEELDVVFPLAATRLCVNAATWTKRTSLQNHGYGEARKKATWPTVLKISEIDPVDVAAQIRSGG